MGYSICVCIYNELDHVRKSNVRRSTRATGESRDKEDLSLYASSVVDAACPRQWRGSSCSERKLLLDPSVFTICVPKDGSSPKTALGEIS